MRPLYANFANLLFAHLPKFTLFAPPKRLRSVCFSFPLRITVVPRELKTVIVQNFGGKQGVLWEKRKKSE